MNLRISITAAVAVILASLSLNAVIQSNGWLVAGIGAVIVVAAVGLSTRPSGLTSAITATFLVLIAVAPLLSAMTWMPRIGGLAIVAITAASATGRRPLRGFAILASYLAALLIYLNLVFTSAASFARIIPTHHSLALLGQMVPDAFKEFKYSPPVPDLRPVSLVAAAGIGLIAIIVDILAVGLRRPALAGHPAARPVQCAGCERPQDLRRPADHHVRGRPCRLPGAAVSRRPDRLRMWGRLVTFRYVQPADETGEGPDTKELAASGRRIGLAAVCLAVIIPMILPTGRARDVFGTTDNGKPHGSGAGLDAFLKVQRQLTGRPEQVLTYTTNADDPGQQYLQVFVLNYSASRNQWLPQFPSGVTGAEVPEGIKLPYQPTGRAADLNGQDG